MSRSPLLAPDASSLFRRELEVLGSGGLLGIKNGVAESGNDLLSFGSQFSASPFASTTKFIGEHWSEAAVAAGIAFLSPRRYMHALLLAASGRGVALATLDGAMSAADPKQDLRTVKERFAGNIAGETRLLLNSLPMTVAGGIAGRGIANAAFGKNLGALDLASGKISLTEVRSNLWKAHDQLFPPRTRLAVLDLDGTLVSTSRQLASGIEAGTSTLAKASGLSQAEVTALMQEQFGKLKSFTNPWTVELALSERLKVGKPGGMSYEEFRSRISDPYWKTLNETGAANLRVYEGTEATLRTLKNENIQTLLFTNSPASAAVPRINLAGLDGAFSKTAMLENARPPANLPQELIQHGLERRAKATGTSSGEIVVSREMAKPAPDFLLDLMKKENLRPSQVIVIGDSLESDMMLAQRSGTRGLWARWSEIDRGFDAQLNKVTGGNFPAAKTSGVPFERELHSVPQILESLRAPRELGGFLRNNFSLPHFLIPAQSYGLTLSPKPER